MDKIICFGKNYTEHMTELGDNPVDKPVIFLKPPSVLKQCAHWGETLPLLLTDEVTHFECELVIKLKQGGYQLNSHDAKAAMGWYTLGLDMTLREIQADLKKAGHPWTIGKVFPDAAVIGPWLELHEGYLTEPFSFTLDGVLRQESNGSAMLFKPIELIVFASQFFPLCAGDILFTGTPAGVGKVHDQSTGVVKLGDKHYTTVWQHKKREGKA